MSIQQTQAYCSHCNDYVLATRPTPNHALHAILTIFTCHLWLYVWIFCCIFRGPYRCTHCGSRV